MWQRSCNQIECGRHRITSVTFLPNMENRVSSWRNRGCSTKYLSDKVSIKSQSWKSKEGWGIASAWMKTVSKYNIKMHSLAKSTLLGHWSNLNGQWRLNGSNISRLTSYLDSCFVITRVNSVIYRKQTWTYL